MDWVLIALRREIGGKLGEGRGSTGSSARVDAKTSFFRKQKMILFSIWFVAESLIFRSPYKLEHQ